MEGRVLHCQIDRSPHLILALVSVHPRRLTVKCRCDGDGGLRCTRLAELKLEDKNVSVRTPRPRKGANDALRGRPCDNWKLDLAARVERPVDGIDWDCDAVVAVGSCGDGLARPGHQLRGEGTTGDALPLVVDQSALIAAFVVNGNGSGDTARSALVALVALATAILIILTTLTASINGDISFKAGGELEIEVESGFDEACAMQDAWNSNTWHVTGTD